MENYLKQCKSDMGGYKHKSKHWQTNSVQKKIINGLTLYIKTDIELFRNDLLKWETKIR